MLLLTAVVGCVFVHLAVLRWMWSFIDRGVDNHTRLLVGGLVLVAVVAHLTEITIFSVAMAITQWWEVPRDQWEPYSELWYDSATAYTTLQANEFPTLAMRITVAVEGLTGFMMITWTASFLFLAMQHLWEWKLPGAADVDAIKNAAAADDERPARPRPGARSESRTRIRPR